MLKETQDAWQERIRLGTEGQGMGLHCCPRWVVWEGAQEVFLGLAKCTNPQQVLQNLTPSSPRM